MSDWTYWLNSKETREALVKLNAELQELEQAVIDGYMLKHASADQIAVDYAHKVGAIEGFQQAVQTLKNLEIEDNDESNVPEEL